MTNAGRWAIVAGSLVALIFIAGFFHSEAKSPVAGGPAFCEAPPPSPKRARLNGAIEAETRDVFKAAYAAAPEAPAGGLLALTGAPGYRRAGELSLRVNDCTKAEDDLEGKLEKIHGEIVDMLMEGTEGSRTCSLSVLIPSNEFRSFITQLRGMGKVQSERITASKLKPGQAEATQTAGAPDPRELSLVSIRMADEKVAQNVLESRGILASSFDRGASHFMKGAAVMVELL